MSGLPDAFRLDGQVIIITGGAGFLGREYARTLANVGAHVVVADIDYEGARKVMEELSGITGVKALALLTDVTEVASVRAMVNQTIAEFGRIDGLINNAAIDPKFDVHHAHEQRIDFEDFPLELWNQSLAVNVTGLFLCAQSVAPLMLAQKKGIIVNIASIYGIVGPDQRLYERNECGRRCLYKPVTYSVTKSAVLGLTRYLATYWAGKNIRVNTLILGGVFHDHDPEFVARYAWRTPLGRMAFPHEAANALLFLLSDASSYMTGTNLIVDGGWTAW